MAWTTRVYRDSGSKRLSLFALLVLIPILVCSAALAQSSCVTSPCQGDSVYDADAPHTFSDDTNSYWQFEENSILNASATDAVSGGELLFLDSSTLNASATGAISGGIQVFRHTAVLNVLEHNALTNNVRLRFDNTDGGPGGSLLLNGFDTVVGSIASAGAGAGIIRNGGADDAVLTIDTTRHGDVSFSGIIEDGGSGKLGIVKSGEGTLTLSGAENRYSGGTRVEGGILQAGAAGALPDRTDYIVNGGGLYLNGFDLTMSSLSGDGGEILLGKDRTAVELVTVTIDQNTDTIYRGNIRGPGTVLSQGLIRLIKDGAGALTLTGESVLSTSYTDDEVVVRGGSLIIAEGGSLRTRGAQFGSADGNQVEVRVSGSESKLSLGSWVRIGLGDDHVSVRIEDGGSVWTESFVAIGYAKGSDAQVTLTGGGRWEYKGNIAVGSRGKGTLEITDGEVMSSKGQSYIGEEEGAEGTVTVKGDGSRWGTSDYLVIGDSGKGTLAILDGGEVKLGHTGPTYNATIGSQNGGEGHVVVDGDGSLWVMRNLYVGSGGTGTLTVANGGEVRSSAVILANHAGSVGTIRIGAGGSAGSIPQTSITFGDGDGVLEINHTDIDFVFATELESRNVGNGQIHHYAGNTRMTADNTAFTGETIVHGGILIVDGDLGGALTVKTGATLSGSGSIGRTTVESGGTLAPGGSLGTLLINGDLVLSPGAILEYRLGSPGPKGDPAQGISGRVSVAGDLTLNGTLNMAQSSAPAAGVAGFGYYRLMTYGGTLAGEGLNIGETPALAVPAGYEIQVGNGNVDLFVAALGDDTMQHWQGGDGTWDASGAQWLNRDGEVAVAWAGNHAIFKNQPGDFNGGTIAVQGTHDFKGLQFVDDGYRLEGDGVLRTHAGGSEIRVLAESVEIATSITGLGGIVKTEDGTLVLSGNNSYSGGTILLGGVTQVATDANLGEASGGLTLNGGTLATTSDMQSSRFVTLAGDGGFDVATGTTLELLGDITGGGDLVKLGAGTLRLVGENTYGDTHVASGELIGDAGSISGHVFNAGKVTFAQTTDANFWGDFAGFGVQQGVVVKTGGGTLTLTGESILNWTVTEGELRTAAERFHGDVDIAEGATLTFDQQQDAVYNGSLSGTGTLQKDGQGRLRLTGANDGFTGDVRVSDGSLTVSGAFGGQMVITGGGTLDGTGTVGTTRVESGGTIAPGNSIGTLTVDGDLTLETGATFAVEVNPEGTESDLIQVTGNVVLNGGAVLHIGVSGSYQPLSTYRILAAGTGLVGSFSQVTSDFAFLTPELVYDYDDFTVDLLLARNDIDFELKANTLNQRATAIGAESLGLGHVIYNTILTWPDDDVLIGEGLDLLSGEIHASIKSYLLGDSSLLRETIYSRVRALRPGASLPSGRVPSSDSFNANLTVGAERVADWGHGFAGRGSSAGDGNASAMTRSIEGWLIGADTHSMNDWRLGWAVGSSRSSFEVKDRDSKGSSANHHVGLYGGTDGDAISLRSGLTYSWHHIETNRSVAIGDFADRPQANYGSRSWQAFGELGYRIDAESVSYEPFIGLAHVGLYTDGFSENGDAAALTSSAQLTRTNLATLGVRFSSAISRGNDRHLAKLNGMIGWSHAFGQTTPRSTHAFAGGDKFTVKGIPVSSGTALVDFGLDLDLSSSTILSISYAGQFASSGYDHALRGMIAVRF